MTVYLAGHTTPPPNNAKISQAVPRDHSDFLGEIAAEWTIIRVTRMGCDYQWHDIHVHVYMGRNEPSRDQPHRHGIFQGVHLEIGFDIIKYSTCW